MPHADFIHLRIHTAYSLSEGAIRIDALESLCLREKMPAVAITDSGNLFGALEFSMAMSEAGIQPIIGCQIGLQCDEKIRKNQAFSIPDQLVLLVQNEEGYANLLKLVSKSFLDSENGVPPQISIADLKELNHGLIALSGGFLGGVGRLLAEGRLADAKSLLVQLSSIFDKRLYVELMRHGMPGERQIEVELLDLAYSLDLPLVATNEVFFAETEMYEAHDALLCISEGTYISQRDRRRLTPEHRFKSAEEMCELFSDLPEAINNTMTIAKRCSFMPETSDPILPVYPKLQGRNEMDVLRELAGVGLQKKLNNHVFLHALNKEEQDALGKPYQERLETELNVIEETGFAGYFLIVADIIHWSLKAGIPVGPGRGSGAGSLVSWALAITDLDPLRWGLVFERFLNPERVTLPDFDLDFCMLRRDEVIRYVQMEYGEDRVAQIITFGKLQARAVLRDVGRVLEMPYSQVDRICKLVPNNPTNPLTLQQAIDNEPNLQTMVKEDELVSRLITMALDLEGLYRHASTHAAGVVIGERPLHQLIPLYRDPRSEMPVTQFSMKYVELAGLVKFDFLGLKTLTVIHRTTEILNEQNISFDLSGIPLDDGETFRLLCEAETAGVFQMESSGMRDVLRKLRPDRFEDIIAVVALYRPGPMDNIPSYINRKHGREKPDYLHSTLEGILKETFGIMIYQEQVLQIAQALSGFTLGNADLLRRAMGKKIQKEMDAQNEAFVQGAVDRGVDKALAGRIFDQVAKFAGYGFNKAHAAAYALVAYQTAYLKAHYTVEFMAASMSFEMGNTDKISTFKNDLERLKISLLAPDINESNVNFIVEKASDGTKCIRYALAAIKNVGASAIEGVVNERNKNGAFKDILDFAQRMDSRILNKRQLESLARAGTFDSICGNRAKVFNAVETIIRFASFMQSDRESSQVNLFGDESDAHLQPVLPECEEWSKEIILEQELESIGFYFSSHPLQAYGAVCQRLDVKSYASIQSSQNLNGRVKLAGVVLNSTVTTSSRGNKMAFIQVSDTSGTFEVTIFSEVLSSCSELILTGKLLYILAEAQAHQGTIRLTAQKIESLQLISKDTIIDLKIFLESRKAIVDLANIVEKESCKGKGHLDLVFNTEYQEIEMSLPGSYNFSPGICSVIRAIPGIKLVQEA